MEGKANKPILERLGNFVGHNNKLGKAITGYAKYREANQIATHFSRYLLPVVATTEAMKAQSYQIRHNVYCEELKLEAERSNKQETDEFDSYSIPCLIQHVSTKTMAGTVRMVRPTTPEQLLPIEKYCLNAISHSPLLPTRFSRDNICEISRLAIPAQFRRRSMDKFAGAQLGGLNPETFSQTELRCFPFIAVGLYLTAAALIIKHDIEHVYVMVEPRLAKNMRLVGIKFKQIGPVIDYHGPRAAHHIDLQSLKHGLSAGFAAMRDDIITKLSVDDDDS
ncbi:hypothetical protein D210916BOD24_08110 [Alteromonas sp. D210916BOD_24]|uniref:PEP-CTERM/exosortase system-associated acyltransferase n=1 Tax=Alteromonas sp. D210916BOD_24 TaxID=3157618 RepID=UPI00399CE4DD